MPKKNHEDLLKRIAEAHKRRIAGISSRGVKKPTPSSHAISKKIITKEVTRPLKQHQRVYNRSVFFSGGIGDVLTIESFLTDDEISRIETVFYATSKREPIEELFRSLLPKISNHISVWDDFSKFWCFYSLNECLPKMSKKLPHLREPLSKSIDLSILKFFEEIKNGQRSYVGSRFLDQHLTDITKFNLPTSYAVICPYSTDKRIKNRDFNKCDWESCLEYLEKLRMKGVVINKGEDTIPQNASLINLANATTITEAVEILKAAKCYIGIDSWLSVLAAKLFDEPYLQVKSNNRHCYENAMLYYAPKRDFSFMVKCIQSPNFQMTSKDNMCQIIKNYPSIKFCELSWCKDQGIMYQTDMSTSVEYDKDYYDKYIGYEKSDIATKLNKGRVQITEKYCSSILDIGIGSGEFIKESRNPTYGFDINKIAVKWLNDAGLYVDPYVEMPDVGGLTFWDSMEHIPNPSELLALVKSSQYVFISMPIFSDLLNLKKSKHYKPNEHYYYFTAKGMVTFMTDSGFETIEIDDFETQSGREDILTFVFRKH